MSAPAAVLCTVLRDYLVSIAMALFGRVVGAFGQFGQSEGVICYSIRRLCCIYGYDLVNTSLMSAPASVL